MRTYKALSQNEFVFENYKLIPIRHEDREKIRNWRNEQMFHLRQSEILTEEKQNWYFENVVAKLFEVEKPNQLLFSFLEKDVLIGYGGLVHINWTDSNAEISFLIDSTKQDLNFELYWTKYLELIKIIAFKKLYFLKIYTYAFDVRPHLYEVLIKNDFKLESRLKNHSIVNNELKDVLIHSCFNKNFELKFITDKDSKLIYNLSIEEENRKNSFNSNSFSFEEHKNWFENEIFKKSFFLKVSIFDKFLIGQVRINKTDNENIIGITIEKQFRGLGLASLVLNKAISLFFSLNANENAIFAYIKAENVASINTFEKAKFNFVENRKINKIESKIYKVVK